MGGGGKHAPRVEDKSRAYKNPSDGTCPEKNARLRKKSENSSPMGQREARKTGRERE